MSDCLREILAEVARRAAPHSALSVFLDFDGTLVAIAGDPAIPRLDAETRRTIERLSSKKCCAITVISGRSLDDLYSRICLPGLIYAGNHGLEIRGGNLNFVEPAAATARGKLEELAQELTAELQPIGGVLVENKGLTLSVHYRQVAEHNLTHVERRVKNVMAGHGKYLRLNTGKKVYEIVPRISWNKGAAARWINHQLGCDERRSIYLGDDRTDEDAFAAMPESISIKVGEGSKTSARYRLPDPQAVHEFLKRLAETMEDGGR